MKNQQENNFNLYKKSSVSGIKWTGLGEILIRGMQFLVTIALARLLVPQDFGIITLALVIIKLIQVFVDFGIAPALIQKKEISREEYNFAFTVLLGISIILFFLLFFFSGFIASLIGNNHVSEVLKYLSFVVTISAANFLPYVILNRSLSFKKIAISEMFSTLGYGIITVTLAFILRNVWCFVFGIIGEQVILGVLLWTYSRYKPAFKITLASYRPLFKFSSSVFLTRFLNFFNLNMLFLLINKFFGSTVLGYFSLAYQIIDLPTQRIAKNIMKVLYPILSKLQDQREEYKALLLKTMFLLSLIVLPIFTLLFVLAKPFVIIFYGEKWMTAVPFIQILCVLGLIRSLWTSISMVSMSLGKPRFEMFLNLSVALLVVPGIYGLSGFGIDAVVVYFVLLILLSFMVGQLRIHTWLHITPREIVRLGKIPLLATSLLLVVVMLVRKINALVFDDLILWNFALVALFSVMLYFVLLYLLDRDGLVNLFKTLMKT
jgi:O-antigen/teichoic acid export membrane protein